MSKVRRSLQSVQGDLTVTDGDIVVEGSDNGLILENTSAELKRVTVRKDGLTDVLEIDNA